MILVAVGTGLTARLPAQIRTCGTTAYGSYLGRLAKKRSVFRTPANPFDATVRLCVRVAAVCWAFPLIGSLHSPLSTGWASG